MLRTITLALYHNTTGHMCYPDCGICTIYMLTTGTTGAIGIDLLIRRIDLDFDIIVDLGRDKYSCKRGMAAISGIEW